MTGSTMGTAARTKKLGAVCFSALAVSVSLLGVSGGTANADDLKANPSAPSAGPVADKGIRPQAIQGELRSADKGVVQAQGTVTGSDEAVPTVKGASPPPGNLAADIGYDCLFAWSQFCGGPSSKGPYN